MSSENKQIALFCAKIAPSASDEVQGSPWVKVKPTAKTCPCGRLQRIAII